MNANPPTADKLVAEYFQLKDQLEAWNKKFAEHIKPTQARLEELSNLLLALLNQQGAESLKTDHGTAYKSTIVTPSIVDRDAYLDFIEQNWGEIGNEMLQLGAPQKKAVQDYMESHNGVLPPGTKISSFTRVNVRRS